MNSVAEVRHERLDEGDAIEQAIAATEQQPQTVQMAQVQIQLPPRGRPAMVAIPQDITVEEAYGLLATLPQIIAQLRTANPASRLVDPTGNALR